jgi:hypothetical protein
MCRDVCDQVGHAEVVALQVAGKNAAGCTAYIEGRDYICTNCQAALLKAGVRNWVMGPPPSVAVDERALNGLPEILREASSILAGESPLRGPIVDELHGFASIVEEYRAALDKTVVEPSKFVLGFWIEDGRIEFSKDDFSTLKDGTYHVVTAPVHAALAQQTERMPSPAVSQQAAPAQTGDLTTVPCPACIALPGLGCDECNGQGRLIVSRKDMAAVSQKDGVAIDVTADEARAALQAMPLEIVVGMVQGAATTTSPSEPEGWRQFIKDCAEASGGMVNGNLLATRARELLDSAQAPSRDAMKEAWQVLLDAGVCPGTEGMSLADGIRAALARAPLPDDETVHRLHKLREEVAIMYQMLDDEEWAEHIAVTPEGQNLETAITKLVSRTNAARAPLPAQGDGMEPERMTIDEAREYLVKFMEQHFTDKTFHRYIRGQIGGSGPLAGDFAWQMVRALRMLFAAPAQAGDALDAARLDFMAQHEAWIAWTKDGESCRVFVRDEDGDTGPLMGWVPEAWGHNAREAIDAAMSASQDKPKGE